MFYLSSLLALVGSGDQPGSSPRTFRLWNSLTKVCFTMYIITRLIIISGKYLRYEFSFYSVVNETQQATNNHLLFKTDSCIWLNNHGAIISPSNRFKRKWSFIVIKREHMLPCLPQWTTRGSCAIRLHLFAPVKSTRRTQERYMRRGVQQVSWWHTHQIKIKQYSLAFSHSNGQMLATVSTVGTVIRVFGIPSGQHLCSFRRGSTHATVHSLSFCPDSCFLLVGSSTGTIHIFSVEESLHKADGTGAGALASSHPSTATSSSRTQSVDSNSNTTTSGAATSAVSSLTSYIGAAQSWGLAVVGGLHIFPEPVQEYADSARAKVKARIPEADASSPYRVAIVSSHASSSSDCGKGSETPASSSAGRLEVVAVTATKRLYRYTVPLPVPPTVDGSPFVCSVDDEAVLECWWVLAVLHWLDLDVLTTYLYRCKCARLLYYYANLPVVYFQQVSPITSNW